MPEREPETGIDLPALLELLESGRPEEICAVSIVLGRLKPGDPRVVPALGAAIERGPKTARSYLLEALARQGDLAAYRFFEPLLLSRGTDREQAVHALPLLGTDVLPAVLRTFERAAPHERGAFARIIARLPSAEGVDALVDFLHEDDFELCKAVHLSVRHTAELRDEALDARMRRALTGLLEGDRAPVTGRIAALKILEHRGGAAELPVVLAIVRDTKVPVLRFTALDALARLLSDHAPDEGLAEAVRGVLCPLLTAFRDDPRLTRASLRILRRGLLCEEDVARLSMLIREADPEFGQFVVRALGEIDGPVARDALLAQLDTADEVLLGALGAALGPREDALEPVLDRYCMASRDLRVTLRRIVDGHGAAIGENVMEAVLDRALDLTRTEDDRVDDLLLLAAMTRERVTELVEARALDPDVAAERRVAWLEPLVRHRLASPGGRFSLALAHFAATSSSACPRETAVERGVQLLVPLGRLEDFFLADRLLAETMIPSDARAALLEAFVSRRGDGDDLVRALREGWARAESAPDATGSGG